MNKSRGWIGVDLDGTLAYHSDVSSIDEIGRPIIPMLNRVKQWLAEGIEVRIVTARAATPEPYLGPMVKQIEDWCETHIGVVLPVTCKKDYQMIQLWDDRAVQVVRNTGQRVGTTPPREVR